jgi:PKD domain
LFPRSGFISKLQVPIALQQILRDLAAWVERGVEPPAATNYRVVDSQIVVPRDAAQRLGIQPLVDLKANGGVRAEIGSGESVTFTAEIEVPPGMGKIVAAQWDFDGQGTYSQATEADQLGESTMQLRTTHNFTKPGTYFPTLRVASQRDGDFRTLFARVQNLDRVRVVVKE